MTLENIPQSTNLQNQGIEQYVNNITMFMFFKQSFVTLFQVRLLLSCLSLCNQVIGNNNLIMGSCHIAHDCKVGNNNIFANGTLLAGHVVVEVSPLFSIIR